MPHPHTTFEHGLRIMRHMRDGVGVAVHVAVTDPATLGEWVGQQDDLLWACVDRMEAEAAGYMGGDAYPINTVDKARIA